MAIAWLPGPAGTRRRVAKLSVEEPDAAEPARPDLWGARVSNDPGLPDRTKPPPHEFLDQFLNQLVVFESHPVAQGSQASRTQRRIGCHRAELLALPEAWHRDTPQASGHRRAGEHACGIINDRIEPYGGCKKILQGTHVFVVAGRHLG